MDLLWWGMSAAERQWLEAAAGQRQVAGLVAAGLGLAKRNFDTPVDEAVLKRLTSTGRRGRSMR